MFSGLSTDHFWQISDPDSSSAAGPKTAADVVKLASRVTSWSTGPEAVIEAMPTLRQKQVYTWFTEAADTGLPNRPLDDLQKGNSMYESGRVHEIAVGKLAGLHSRTCVMHDFHNFQKCHRI